MTINITIFIQMIHFWLAYAIIRTIVLKPLFSFIRQEDEELASLQDDIASLHDTTVVQEQTKQQEWENFQQSFIKRQPLRPEVTKVAVIESEEVIEFSKEQQQKIKHDLMSFVVDRVKHVSQ